ncbi:hypothetical protein FNU79_18720 [Deinococcus detaillensis]|uniref:Uncharacterized protein n=1 Tax=Deinococcus detaillensis TaxID=2592048 RepID=A0A553UEY0_9DEIO|nr:hypothetical protein [Deinococcus detaillensis]TSA78774.1 hypothetical protein FNU79_18720 [Deinococcus detaillensis]
MIKSVAGKPILLGAISIAVAILLGAWFILGKTTAPMSTTATEESVQQVSEPAPSENTTDGPSLEQIRENMRNESLRQRSTPTPVGTTNTVMNACKSEIKRQGKDWGYAVDSYNDPLYFSLEYMYTDGQQTHYCIYDLVDNVVIGIK